MISHFWTRNTAISILIFLFLLTATLTIIGSVSVAKTITLALIQMATATIALFIPLSRKNEARRKMQSAMNQYVILQSLKGDSSQKNRVINRMHELAPIALYSQEEIASYLDSTDVGERFAALAIVQWQWQNPKVHTEMDLRFKKPRELPKPPKHPSKGYFLQLLEVLCGSWDSFENYHATVAMWSMVDSLDPKDIQKLFHRVLEENEGSLGYKCERVKWDKFIEYPKNKRKSPQQK